MKISVAFFLTFLTGAFCFSQDGYKRDPMIDVIQYIFNLSLSDTSDVIYGKAGILVRYNGKSSSFGLDLKNAGNNGRGMIVDSVFLDGTTVGWIHRENRIIISGGGETNAGEEQEVIVYYHGIPSDGLIISNNRFGSRTFFSDHWPDRARNYLPCIDHPYDKAKVEFIIKAPIRYEVVANGYLAEKSFSDQGTKITHWKETVPLATKVMAFGAAPFAMQYAGNVSGIPVWTYVFRENREEGFSDYAPAVKPLSFFTGLIGPYPYSKLANVQSKTIYGGLENAGCIFYSERSVTGQGTVENLLAHEIAHQWFGNSVTENDWQHIWLSEGFATYLTSVYQEMNYGKEKMKESMRSSRTRVLDFYDRSPCPVIDTSVTNLMRLLNDNSYQKGAWVLHMLRCELGDELFWKGMRLYYERFRDKNALTEDFKNIMEEVTNRDLDQFFHQWLRVAGQPDLMISTTPSARKGRTDLIIEQQQEHLYRFNFEFLAKSTGKSFHKAVSIRERTTKIILKTGQPVEIIPDPDVKLLFRILP
jgi:aminopeptidase N